MHLAVLFEFPTLHGGERSFLAVFEELRRRQADVTVTACAPPDGPLAAALAARGIVHVPWSVRDEHNARRSTEELETSLVRILDELKPDLVHANSLSMGRLLGRIADRIEQPACAHLRDIVGLSAAAVRDLNRNARLIAVSQATSDFHVARGLDRARVEVIHNGIDLAEFSPRAPTGYLHRELGLRPDAILIAAIGQIGLRKGWDVLAAAMSMLGALPESVELLLVGVRHSDKEESRRFEDDLRQKFVSAGWERHVHWLGERRDVARLMNELALLVHPAKQEPLGRVLIEALASGVPIVATDVGGTREIIEPNVSGRLVPPSDPHQLALALAELLADRVQSKRFRTESRRRAEQHFDIRTAADRTLACWRSVRR